MFGTSRDRDAGVEFGSGTRRMTDSRAPHSVYPVEHEATATAGAEGALLDEIVRRLTEALAPERIYLFGSRARGDAGPDSDYDLLVVVREYVGDRRAMSVEGFSALTGLGISKDVVLMSRHE